MIETGRGMGQAPGKQLWQVRQATEADLDALVTLRRALFAEMGYRDEQVLEHVAGASAAYLVVAIPAGGFRGWVAEAQGTVVASGGLVIHPVPPTPQNTAGKEGYIMNMYTCPGWRGQGVATAILRAMLDYLRDQAIPTVSLHATPEGQHIYEQAGFRPSNEMRLQLDRQKQEARQF